MTIVTVYSNRPLEMLFKSRQTFKKHSQFIRFDWICWRAHEQTNTTEHIEEIPAQTHTEQSLQYFWNFFFFLKKIIAKTSPLSLIDNNFEHSLDWTLSDNVCVLERLLIWLMRKIHTYAHQRVDFTRATSKTHSWLTQINENYCHLKRGRARATPNCITVLHVAACCSTVAVCVCVCAAEEMNGNGNHLICKSLFIQRIIWFSVCKFDQSGNGILWNRIHSFIRELSHIPWCVCMRICSSSRTRLMSGHRKLL